MWSFLLFSGVFKSFFQECWKMGFFLKGYMFFVIFRLLFFGDFVFFGDFSYGFFGVRGWLCFENGEYLFI